MDARQRAHNRMLRQFLAPFSLLLAVIAMAEAVVDASGNAASVGGIKCLFSDIDGTLVHYYPNEEDAPGLPEVIPLPASSTGRMGRVSLESLKLAARIRSSGARLVLVTGTRYSTFASRLPYLPRADAYCIEDGGRIFYPKETVTDKGEAEDGGSDGGEESAVGDPSLTGHAPSALREDLAWRAKMESITGGVSQDDKAPEDRAGPLWDLYRKIVAEGFEVDTKSYYTMLRIKLKDASKKRVRDEAHASSNQEDDPEQKGGAAALKKLLQTLPPGLHVVTNLGLVDICPATSGKHNAAAYLAKEHFKIPLGSCASMGDDDNDIELAKTMGKGAFITTFSSESVEAAAKEDPKQFTVAKEEWVLATEEMFTLILAGSSAKDS